MPINCTEIFDRAEEYCTKQTHHYNLLGDVQKASGGAYEISQFGSVMATLYPKEKVILWNADFLSYPVESLSFLVNASQELDPTPSKSIRPHILHYPDGSPIGSSVRTYPGITISYTGQLLPPSQLFKIDDPDLTAVDILLLMSEKGRQALPGSKGLYYAQFKRENDITVYEAIHSETDERMDSADKAEAILNRLLQTTVSVARLPVEIPVVYYPLDPMDQVYVSSLIERYEHLI